MKIMVLGDGETYTLLAGCKIVDLADREYDDLDAVVQAICEDGHTVDGRVIIEFTAEGTIVITP